MSAKHTETCTAQEERSVLVATFTAQVRTSRLFGGRYLWRPAHLAPSLPVPGDLLNAPGVQRGKGCVYFLTRTQPFPPMSKGQV